MYAVVPVANNFSNPLLSPFASNCVLLKDDLPKLKDNKML